MRCLHSQFCLDLTLPKCASYLLQTGVRAGAAVRDAAGVPGVPVRDAAGGADAQRARRQPLGARHQDDLRRHPLARHIIPGMAWHTHDDDLFSTGHHGDLLSCMMMII